jgi:hypothetical protein
MSTTDLQSQARGRASVKDVDMKLEVVVIPVPDIDGAKEFHGRLVAAGIAMSETFHLGPEGTAEVDRPI